MCRMNIKFNRRIVTVFGVVTVLGLAACSRSDSGAATAATPPAVVAAESSPSPAPTDLRTLPNPACPEDALGTTGVLEVPDDPGLFPATSGGVPATPEVLATLPERVFLRGQQENYSAQFYYAVRDGRIYIKANEETTGVKESWRTLLLPRCLDGHVTEVSADAGTVVALDESRWLYTLDTHKSNPLGLGWTRRWGPFFWSDLGMQVFPDAKFWAASDLSPGDNPTYTDSAGRQAKVAGILTVYTLRSDNRLTYLDPWLPSDESREICAPENGELLMTGLSGSGSTVMVVGRNGEIYTRLYEFDVSGGNTVFLDYSWQDQQGVANPKAQLPAPDWVHHPRISGAFTNRLSIRQVAPGTDHRILRVEGQDAAGRNGYWQKDLADRAPQAWTFTVTNEPLQGTLLPLPKPYFTGSIEAYDYSGTIDGYNARIEGFRPYCSPVRMQVDIAGTPLDLTLHSTDGLRQSRRARGLDGIPHNYRGAVEVSADTWNQRDRLPQKVRDFLTQHFADNRILQTPLIATRQHVEIMQPCWKFSRETSYADDLVSIPDPGAFVGELLDEQEQGRQPPLCSP
jgi:hypothetical protein